MTHTPSFNPDRPILTSGEDALGRENFVKLLSSAIAEWKERDDSLVLGLTGPWGCGKTSIKNLVIEKLKKEKSVHNIEFNPWEWSTSSKVNEAFFKELGKLFQRTDIAEQSEELANKWTYYSELVNLISIPIPKLFRLPFAEVFSTAAKAHKARKEFLKKELEEIKKELSEELLKIKRTILVVVDDIDRLLPEELKIVIQLIKANADFPNIVYMLLLDKEAVSLSLEKLVAEKGEEYLRKIIQVEITVPPPNHEDIVAVLIQKLNEIDTTDSTSEERFDKDRWVETFAYGIKHFFANLRDVYRFCSSLSFSFSSYVKNDVLEVNTIDLVSLECLKLFEKQVFEAVYLQKELLIKKPSDAKKEKEVESVLNEIVALASKKNSKAVKQIIGALFPHMEPILDTGLGFSTDLTDQWGKEKRICHHQWFDTYFRMSLPEKFIHTFEEKQIIKTIEDGDYQALLDLCQSFIDSDRFGLLLDFLNGMQTDISDDKLKNLLAVMFTIGDSISDDDKSGMFVFSFFTRLSVYCWRLFEDRMDGQKRKWLFLEAMKTSSGISIPTYIIRSSLDEKYSDFWSNEDISELKKSCVNRAKEFILDNTIWDVNSPASILLNIIEWGDEKEIKALLKEQFNDEKNLIKFLTVMLSESKLSTSSKPGIQIRYSMSLKSVGELIEIDELKQLVDKIDRKPLNDFQQNAVDYLYIAIQRKKEGKSDDRWNDVWDEE